MSLFTRRTFIQLVLAAGASSAVSALGSCTKGGSAKGRVIVIGGGFGGSTCARYLNKFDSRLSVTLIEPAHRFVTCPFSNVVLGGTRDLNSISHGYDGHRRRGVNVIQQRVKDIDAVKKTVTLEDGKTLEYDRLVVSPGIDFRWDAVTGMEAKDAEVIPHAWQGGPQTTLLRQQLEAMSDGGVVLIAPPDNPFRCPPGPYERASLIAHYLKQYKPKSKILILDAKDKFSKQPLFMQGWAELYPGMIEWVAGTKGGRIDSVDVATRTVHTNTGDKHKADVINLIPPQKAANLAARAGLIDDAGWCPVDQRNFESKKHAGIHVIGDACVAGKMPKSGFAANSQGKVCAAAIVTALQGKAMPEPSYVNTCYSLVSPDYGISVAAVYRFSPDKGIYGVEGAGGVSPKDADKAFRQQEARYAEGWYQSITSDAFG